MVTLLCDASTSRRCVIASRHFSAIVIFTKCHIGAASLRRGILASLSFLQNALYHCIILLNRIASCHPCVSTQFVLKILHHHTTASLRHSVIMSLCQCHYIITLLCHLSFCHCVIGSLSHDAIMSPCRHHVTMSPCHNVIIP
jgi:hypothetical protein